MAAVEVPRVFGTKLRGSEWPEKLATAISDRLSVLDWGAVEDIADQALQRAPLCVAPGAPDWCSHLSGLTASLTCATGGTSPGSILGKRAVALRRLEWSPAWQDSGVVFDSLLNICQSSLASTSEERDLIGSLVISTLSSYARDRLLLGSERAEILKAALTKFVDTAETSELTPPTFSRQANLVAASHLLNSLTCPNPTLPMYQTRNNISSNKSATPNRPVLVIADIHGRADCLKKVLSQGIEIAQQTYGMAPTVVTVGDYIDNNLQVVDTLDVLISLRWEMPGLAYHILGNHDLACLCTLHDNYRGAKSVDWWLNWHHYWNSLGVGTPAQYMSNSQEEFRSNMSAIHSLWLDSLPWALRLDNFLFVHHGIGIQGQSYFRCDWDVPSLDQQLQELERRDLFSWGPGHLPYYMSQKFLPRVYDKSWPFIVVSGHVKTAGFRNIVAPTRVVMHSGTCLGQNLRFAVFAPGQRLTGASPEALWLEASPTGVLEVPPSSILRLS
ncbi:Serine/threonine protein phosphatase family protein [Pelomyxa schiedti]|nr:Serine/threonine protein phosphatase family protein [Pelomyxa schiedti]